MSPHGDIIKVARQRNLRGCKVAQRALNCRFYLRVWRLTESSERATSGKPISNLHWTLLLMSRQSLLKHLDLRPSRVLLLWSERGLQHRCCLL